MSAPGFHWFVAWRYLMARPRRLSGIIVLFAAVFAWIGGAVGYATFISPLTDEYIAAGMPLPAWFPLTFAMPLALSTLALLIAVARALPRLSGGWRALFFVSAIRVLGASPWPPRRRLAVLIASGGVAALIQLFIVVAMGSEELVFDLASVPGLAEDPLPLTNPCLLVAIACTLLALGLARLLRGPARARALRLAGLVAASIPVVLAHIYWWGMVQYGVNEAGGAALDYHAPVWMTIVYGLAGALFTLSLILLGIRYFFTFFTTVSMGGVAIGTMALVVTLSVMSGFETDLRGKILGSNAHVLITRHDEAPFAGYRDVMGMARRIRGVVAQTPYLTSEVVIAGSSNYFNVVVKGIDPRTIASVTNLGKDLDDEEALERIWPLTPKGEVTGPPVDKPSPREPDKPQPRPEGEVIDPAPGDLQVSDSPPVDWSGAAGSSDAPAQPAERVDPAPPDLDVGEGAPTDWSGGLTESPEQPLADAATDEPLVEGEGEPPPDDIGSFEDEWLPPPARELEPHVAALPGVLVGAELVNQIHLYEGQEVKIISPLGQNTIAGQTPYIKSYRVAGMFYTGMYEYDLKRIYVELGTLQDFLDLPDEVTGIEIRVRDPEDTEPIIAGLRRALGPGFTVQDWKELNRSLFSALKLEKIAMFLVLAIIILVASFSIIGNLIMVVVEKAREIAVLKTLGASDVGVTRIFVVQGMFIGMIGTLIGVSLGLVACLLSDRYGVGIPPDVYYIDRLPIHVEPLAVALVAAAGLVISVGATIYPAHIAARLRPVQGLRYE